MNQRLLLPLLCCVVGFASTAKAQVTIDKSQSVADARRDAGTGACGTFIQYKRQGTPAMPPRTKMEAEALLNKPATDMTALKGRISRLVDRINFRNGQTGFVEGDFTGAMYPDELMPYSASSMASPTGDDSDIAMRMRGYFNVSSDLAGKTISFGLNCDDFCSLRIGKTDVIPEVNITGNSPRVIKQVKFPDAGLYPIEMVYFQTVGPAYIEWAVADQPQPECNSNCTAELTNQALYGGKFNLVPQNRLYSAVVGENRPCQECGAPGLDCNPGNYCGDGLCQNCDLPDHCGATCMKCPSNARICSFGKCVECTADDQCPAGRVCENNICSQPMPCSRNEQCPPMRVCDTTTNTCKMPPPPCTTDAMCPAGQICGPMKFCITPPTRCTSDAQCNQYQYCDTAAQECKAKQDARYVGGLAGCSFGQGPSQGASGAGWVALAGLLLGGLVLRARRREATAGAPGGLRRGGLRLFGLLLPVFFFLRLRK